MHCSTFSHQAALERYNRDPSGNKSADSNEFLSGFCAVLQGFSVRQKLKKGAAANFDDEWVDSNLVYQEYIKDRHHIHLSATRWKSVAGFVRFLGQKGIAEVKRKKATSSGYEDSDAKYIFGQTEDDDEDADADEDEDNISEEDVFEKDPTKRPKWFIKLIDKSPEAILAAKSKSAAEKKFSEEETLQARQLALVEKRAKSSAEQTLNTTKTTVPIVPVMTIKQQTQQPSSKRVASIFEESSDSEVEDQQHASNSRKKNAVLEEIAAEHKREKGPEAAPVSYYPKTPIVISIDEDENNETEDEVAWIRKGLLIKIGNDSLGDGKYFNLLAVIDEVIDDFGAQVTVLKSGDQLLLDQDDCLPVSRVEDEDFDHQLSSLDPKIMSTALKTDRCVLLAPGSAKGKEGRVLSRASGQKEFKVEISAAGSSQIHRRQFDLVNGQFCIYWE